MKVEIFKINGWKDLETGLLIDEIENWILVKHIPIDYVIDGFKIYNKKFIEERLHSDKEKQIEKVLRLKGIKVETPVDFKFHDTEGQLKWVEDKYGVFEFQDDDESEVIYGRINRVMNDTMVIDMIKSDGSVETNYEYEFDLNEIRAISFETDYHQSICLLWKDVLKDTGGVKN